VISMPSGVERSEPRSSQTPRDAVFNNLGQLADLMKNAGKIREGMEKAAESMAKLEVEGTAGGGVVSAKVNGRMELLSLRIDPKLLSDGDSELLEDLIVAAVNQGLTKAREAAAQSFSSLAGGLPIPGLSGFLGPGAGGS
jgi:DNA-binding YbaB/EbfC family protein